MTASFKKCTGFEAWGAAPQPNYPYHLVWLATNACNARCLHCSSASGIRRPAELDTTEAKSLFAGIAQMGVLDVAISGGEPLIRADLFTVIAHASRFGIRTGLGSNGSTVTLDGVRHLRDSGLHRLQISIDGVEETHDRVRCWPGLYRKAVKAIELSLATGLRTHVCCTVHRLNHRELARIFEACIIWGVQRLNISRFVPTGRGDKDLDLSPGEWEHVVDTYEALQREYRPRLEVSTHLAQMILSEPALGCHPSFAGCQAGRGQGCIGPEGEVFPCVVLPIVVGNIREASFDRIWTSSPVIRALQSRSMLKGRCATCYFREKCGGCRAVAYSYSGDFLASDPRCWFGFGTESCGSSGEQGRRQNRRFHRREGAVLRS